MMVEELSDEDVAYITLNGFHLVGYAFGIDSRSATNLTAVTGDYDASISGIDLYTYS